MADPKSLFTRVKNRTAADVFSRFIQPELETLANDLGQKIIYDAKRTHGYKNRTGALEDSKKWEVRKDKQGYDLAVQAGGYGRVQFPFKNSKRQTKLLGPTPTGGDRRIRRRGQILTSVNPNILSERTGLKKGNVVVVDYAGFVEKKGFSVLIDSVNRYKHKVSDIMSAFLRGKTTKI